MKRMRLRSKAALYKGKTRGPKVSRKSGRDDAGWNGVRAGLKVSRTSASLKARVRFAVPGRSPGRDRRFAGETMGESGAEDSVPPIR